MYFINIIMKDTAFKACCFIILLCCGQIYQRVAAQPLEYSSILNDVSLSRFGTMSFGDFDQDGRQDLFITGKIGSTYFAQFLRYDGIFTVPTGSRLAAFGVRYSDIPQSEIQPVVYSSSAVTDIDRDGDLDLLTVGATDTESPITGMTTLYRNNGIFRFTISTAGIPGLYSGSAAFGDYDNDGDPDLIITGVDHGAGYQYATRLYRNDGSDGFFRLNIPLEGKAYGDVAWGDYDNDGDLDILLTGASSQIDATYRAVIYRNDGDGTFTDIYTDLYGLYGGSVDWGDYDSDGDLDILMTGGRPAPGVIQQGYTFVYRNDQGSFVDIGGGIQGVSHGDAHWGDYNGDGQLDILITGFETALDAMRRTGGQDAYLFVFLQTGEDSFEFATRNIGFMFGATAGADFDADGDLDFISSGEGLGSVSRFYFNQARVLNAPPSAPSSLREQVNGDTVTLQWDPASDALTPSAGLSYNLRVGTAPGGIDVVAPMALIETGQRLISALGNVHLNRVWTLKNLPPGTYYWSVQALDHAYVGSLFSEERSFVVD